MKTKKKKNFIELVTEFAKLQLAGNIPFWGTYFGYMLFDKVFGWTEFSALAVATILANTLFFIVDDKWVFANTRGKRKNPNEVLKFIVFMSFNALLNFSLTFALLNYLGLTPYIGQFISAAVFTVWTFVGLRFWVFAPPRHHTLFAPRTKRKKPRHRTERTV